MLCRGRECLKSFAPDSITVPMAKSQNFQPKPSSMKQKAKAAAKDSLVDDVAHQMKKKRKKTEYEETDACAPVIDVKKKKKDKNEITAFKSKKKKKQLEAKTQGSDEFIFPAGGETPAGGEMPAGGKTPAGGEKPAGGENDGVRESGMEELDGLSPEERRVLERKMKKIRRKEEKKKLKAEGKTEKKIIKTNVAESQALEYLKSWSEKREEWKFQKTRQVWLLQHMYDSEKVSDAHFEVLLLYLEGLRGVARETTVQKAEALVRWSGQEETEDKIAEAQKKAHRAKEVVQILS